MKARLWLAAVLVWTTGCRWLSPHHPAPPPPCSEYHCADFPARLGPRILLLPLANETCFPQAGDQVRDALASELQCIGRLEVIVPPCASDPSFSQLVHLHGRFDEAAMLNLARTFGVDTIVLGTLTDYQPYVPQRIGLSLRLISPPAAAVIASVDGLWDARDKALAEQVCVGRNPICDGLRASFKNELILASPQQFERYVCHQAVQVLLTPAQAAAANSAQPAPAQGAAAGSAPFVTTETVPEMREVR